MPAGPSGSPPCAVPFMRLLPYWICFPVALVCVYMAVVIWVREPEHLIQTFTHDDSFYYLQTARNVASGAGVTFDGHNLTNGFHPLWLIGLVPLYVVPWGDPVLALRAVLTFQLVAFCAPSLFLLHVLGRRWAGALGGVVALSGGLWFLPSRQVNAMESGILLLLAVVFAYWSASVEPWTGGSWVDRAWTGFWLGLLFLARTDSIMLVVAFGVVTTSAQLSRRGWRTGLKELPAHLMPIGLVLLAVTLPYLLWNVSVFGHLMPISGALKTTLPSVTFSLEHLDSWVLMTVVVILGGTLWSLFEMTSRARRRSGIGVHGTVLTFGLYSLSHAAFSVVAMDWGVFDWHFALYVIPLILLAVAFVARVQDAAGALAAVHRRRIVALVAIVGIVLSLVRVGHSVRERPLRAFYVFSYRAARWVDTNLPVTARIGMKDSGAFGYFSDRSVTNLDGVINNFTYQDILVESGIQHYLESQDIGYLAQHALWEFPVVERGSYGIFSFPFVSRLHDAPGGSVMVAEKDEVYRAPSHDGARRTFFTVWRLEPRRSADMTRRVDLTSRVASLSQPEAPERRR